MYQDVWACLCASVSELCISEQVEMLVSQAVKYSFSVFRCLVRSPLFVYYWEWWIPKSGQRAASCIKSFEYVQLCISLCAHVGVYPFGPVLVWHVLSIQALKETNPHLLTIATLTGHAVRAVGPNYSVSSAFFVPSVGKLLFQLWMVWKL